MLSSARKLFLLLLVIPHFLFSEKNDSLKVVKIKTTTQYFNSNQFEYADSSTYINNTLDNFQNDISHTTIANSGLPFNDLFYHPMSNSLGFNDFKNNYQNYFYTPQNLKFYTTRVPFTDLFYVTGTKKEQIFKMTFSYNVKKNWNVSFDFSRFRSTGFFDFDQLSTINVQEVVDNFIAVSSNYKSKNNRYLFLTSVIYNNAKNNESGGVTNDSTFEN